MRHLWQTRTSWWWPEYEYLAWLVAVWQYQFYPPDIAFCRTPRYSDGCHWKSPKYWVLQNTGYYKQESHGVIIPPYSSLLKGYITIGTFFANGSTYAFKTLIFRQWGYFTKNIKLCIFSDDYISELYLIISL